MIKYIIVLWLLLFVPTVFASRTVEQECKVFTDVASKMVVYKNNLPKEEVLKQTLMEAVRSSWSSYEVIMMVDLIEFVYKQNGTQSEIANKYEYYCNRMLTPKTEM